MSLQDVVKWAIYHNDKEKLKCFVARDPRGNPMEHDMIVCKKLLDEIINRAKLSEDHMNKAIKYERDIAEYIGELEKRGVKYRDIPRKNHKEDVKCPEDTKPEPKDPVIAATTDGEPEEPSQPEKLPSTNAGNADQSETSQKNNRMKNV